MNVFNQLYSPAIGKDTQDSVNLKSDKSLKSLKHHLTHHSSNHSSSNSFHFASSTSSPKSSSSINQFNFSDNLAGTDELHNSSRTSANKVRNFEKAYLEIGLWPDIEVKDQAKVKSQLRKVKSELNWKKGRISELKKEIINNRESCTSCAEWKKKNESTQLALKQAIDLSNLLLLEMKKSEN